MPDNREGAEWGEECATCGEKARREDDLFCSDACASADWMSDSAVRVPQELVSRVLALCSYVGDHGGGERERCATGAERCPSCAANAIATELSEVAGMTYGR